MNELQVFENSEFGEIRTITKDNEPMFCLSDVCKALELEQVSRVKSRLKADGVTTSKVIDRLGREQEATFINESNLYKTIFQSRKDSAERFTDWVTSEVLPSIRKTGGYNKPMTTAEQIKLLAQGNTELSERMDRLENDMPLYGCEIDEIQSHVKRKAVNILGGKQSNAYKDASTRNKVFADMWNQLKREYGCVSTYKSIKRKYIADVHDFIDCYELPRILEEEVHDCNAQIRMELRD
nr:MAG TPA: hypothetical protein [Caudoviricetes sp.]